MNENFIEAQYNVTKKSKLKNFYDSYKIFIYSSLILISIFIISITIYSNFKKEQNVIASENYLKAKIYLSSGKKEKAIILLKDIVFQKSSTYSTLAFFLILNQNLITEKNQIESMFEHVIKNNNFDNELKNLLIYKKLLFSSDYINESDLLRDIKPLLKDSSVWRSHALLLAGDYFLANKEGKKAMEFYQEVLSIKNLHRDLYDHAMYQLVIIKNELL
jgi:predicted negative regulator of RcsB-dependent stress response